MDDPRDIAMYAAELVTGDRQIDYDHPLDNFTRAGKIWEAILGVPVTAEQVALCMVGVKIARESNKAKLDNTIDGIGYFLTLAMVQQERAERDREIERDMADDTSALLRVVAKPDGEANEKKIEKCHCCG